MKKRLGFVSNSSSSSFICDVDGEEISGWDMCLSEAGMYQCENGHTFCECYVNYDEEHYESVEEQLIEEVLKKDKDYKEEYEDDCLQDLRYGMSNSFCPICSFTHICDEDAVAYITHFYELSYSQAHAYMKAQNSRLRKVRASHWFGLLEQEKGINEQQVKEEIKSKFNNYEEFYNSL